MYTSDNHASTDGGQLMYELDSFGIIYSRSTTWRSYVRLQSNNDSINSLIGAALETILLYSKLSCYRHSLPSMETIQFTPPKTEEENK